MKTVGIYEAKTQFPKLVAEVEAGETIIITRHGHPVARLGPVGLAAEPDREAAVRALQEFAERHQIRLGGITIRELIEEGRRY